MYKHRDQDYYHTTLTIPIIIHYNYEPNLQNLGATPTVEIFHVWDISYGEQRKVPMALPTAQISLLEQEILSIYIAEDFQ